MKRLMTYSSIFALTMLLIAGCGSPKTEKTNDDTGALPDLPPDTVDTDGHATHGPHDGDLIELGNEEFHAELLHPEHGEKSAVTIYILDGSAKKQVPIDAETVFINVTHDGKPEQFTLNAQPDQGDPTGQSSRFSSSDAELLEHASEEEFEGRLVVKIKGKSYNGKIAHDHDHAGHAH